MILLLFCAAVEAKIKHGEIGDLKKRVLPRQAFL